MQGTCTAELLILETISAKRYRYTRRSRPSYPSSLDARRWPGVVRKSVKILYQKRLWRPSFLPLRDLPFELGRIFCPAQPRRGGRVAECDGLLIWPTRSVLISVHVFC